MANPTFVISQMGKVEEKAVDLTQAVLIIARMAKPIHTIYRDEKTSLEDTLDIHKVALRRHRLRDSTGQRKDIFAYWPDMWRDEWGVREFMKHVMLKYPTMPYLTQYQLTKD